MDNLSFSENVSSVHFPPLPRLANLTVSECKMNLDFIYCARNLRDFKLRRKVVQDVSFLGDLTQLESLHVICEEFLCDFSPLWELTTAGRLRSLKLISDNTIFFSQKEQKILTELSQDSRMDCLLVKTFEDGILFCNNKDVKDWFDGWFIRQ